MPFVPLPPSLLPLLKEISARRSSSLLYGSCRAHSLADSSNRRVHGTEGVAGRNKQVGWGHLRPTAVKKFWVPHEIWQSERGHGFQNIGMHFNRMGCLLPAIERVAMGVYRSLISTVTYPQLLSVATIFVMWYYL